MHEHRHAVARESGPCQRILGVDVLVAMASQTRFKARARKPFVRLNLALPRAQDNGIMGHITPLERNP
jgi:hypothetical protein